MYGAIPSLLGSVSEPEPLPLVRKLFARLERPDGHSMPGTRVVAAVGSARSAPAPEDPDTVRSDSGFGHRPLAVPRSASPPCAPLAGSDRLKATLVSTPLRHTIAIYPGSFDPITNGHRDIIERAAKIVDRLIVAVLNNEQKTPLFSVAERVEMMGVVSQEFDNVEVDSFEGLLVDYAASKSATAIVRGIRAISDYENELQMALMNRRLRPEVETIFLMAGEQYSFVSSRLVKEVIRLGGEIRGLVPPVVEERLKNRIFGVSARS